MFAARRKLLRLDFFPARGILDGCDFEIAEGGGVEDDVDIFRDELLQFFHEIVIGAERNYFVRAKRRWIGWPVRLSGRTRSAPHWQSVGERDPQPAGRKIREPPHLIDRFVTRTGSDDHIHRTK